MGRVSRATPRLPTRLRYSFRAERATGSTPSVRARIWSTGARERSTAGSAPAPAGAGTRPATVRPLERSARQARGRLPAPQGRGRGWTRPAYPADRHHRLERRERELLAD